LVHFSFILLLNTPSIPCFVVEIYTVYPLEGTCLLTGPEYLLAINQGCEITIKSAFYIPPTIVKKNKNKNKNNNNNNNNNRLNDLG
jgi:hypothetical protein